MDESKAYEKAKRQVEDLKDFYIHLIVYVFVNLLLFGINILTSPDYLWFLYPLGGWGIGLILHGLSLKQSFLGSKWEEKKIHEFMEKNQDKDT